MKRALILTVAILMSVLFASCGTSTEQPTDETESTVVINITSQPIKETKSNGVEIKEEVVEKATRNSNINTTEPTEATAKAKKKSSKKVPTQGVTEPGTHIAVTTAPSGSFKKSDLEFVFEGAYIDLNDEIDDALALLGDDNSVTELSKTKTEYEYYNLNLTLITYTSKDVERVEQITITGDSLATEKGAKVGMYASQLRTVYGEPTKKTDNAYTYTLNDKSLSFTYSNNIVTSYSYILKH